MAYSNNSLPLLIPLCPSLPQNGVSNASTKASFGKRLMMSYAKEIVSLFSIVHQVAACIAKLVLVGTILSTIDP